VKSGEFHKRFTVSSKSKGLEVYRLMQNQRSKQRRNNDRRREEGGRRKPLKKKNLGVKKID